MKITLSCDNCSQQFETHEWRIKNNKNNYCSKSCKDSHHKILYGSKISKEDYFKAYYIKNRAKKIEQAKVRASTRTAEKREYDLRRRKECAVRLSAERRERYNSNRGWEQVKTQMLAAAKARAKKQCVPCEISVDDISIPKICPVLGIELVWNKGCAKPNSPSLDKIIPSLGYVKGNVAVISCRANKIKNNASLEEISLLHAWITSVLTS